MHAKNKCFSMSHVTNLSQRFLHVILKYSYSNLICTEKNKQTAPIPVNEYQTARQDAMSFKLIEIRTTPTINPEPSQN